MTSLYDELEREIRNGGLEHETGTVEEKEEVQFGTLGRSACGKSPSPTEVPGPEVKLEIELIPEDPQAESSAVQGEGSISLSGIVWQQPSSGCVPPTWCLREEEDLRREEENRVRDRVHQLVGQIPTQDLLPNLPDVVMDADAELPPEYDMTDCIEEGSTTDTEIEFGNPGPRDMNCTDTIPIPRDTDSTDDLPM